jgi:hypothetical protein
MSLRALSVVSFLALAPLSLPASADECANATRATAQKPVSAVMTKIDAQGKQTILASVRR